MLAHRVIPTILVRGRQAFKGVGFDSWRPIGLAAEKVRVHAARGVDEIVILDIAASKEGRGPDLGLVEELSRVLFAPLAVGGGVRSLKDVRALLRAGADKVVIGAAAFENPGLVPMCASVVGNQAIVVSLDVASGICWTHNGTVPRPEFQAVFAAKHFETYGAGEILLQSTERDGTMRGYDLATIKSVAPAVGIPVIASGGAGTYQHMLEAIQAGADAVAASAMFQFTDQTPKGASMYLKQNGIEART